VSWINDPVFAPWCVRCSWCGRDRGYLPERGAPTSLVDLRSPIVGVMICGTCDYNHAGASVIPREDKIKDAG